MSIILKHHDSPYEQTYDKETSKHARRSFGEKREVIYYNRKNHTICKYEIYIHSGNKPHFWNQQARSCIYSEAKYNDWLNRIILICCNQLCRRCFFSVWQAIHYQQSQYGVYSKPQDWEGLISNSPCFSKVPTVLRKITNEPVHYNIKHNKP